MPTIRKRGNKWQAQVRLAGAQPTSRSFHFKKDAEIWATEQERAITLGEHRISVQKQASATVRDLLIRYLETCVPQKRCADYEAILVRALLRTNLAKLNLKSIHPGPFADYRDKRLGIVGAAIVRRELGILRHMFDIAIREWEVSLSSNPLTKISKPKEPPPRNRRLEPQEYQLLMKGCALSQVTYLKPIITIALETAMRRGEILNIEREHINRSKMTLEIPITKNGHSRIIPLSSRALTTLYGTLRGHSERVFPVTPNAFRLAWERLRKRVGLEDLHFHDLRHEAISRLFEKGLSIPEVALISGHRDFRMLFRYTHLRAEDIAHRLNEKNDVPSTGGLESAKVSYDSVIER